MAEHTQSAGGTGTRPAMTPHEMLAASARLGGYAPRARRNPTPRFVHPQQYDESGFPIRADRAGFAERVRQLLRG
jgi:hypothetical protein